jgi:hypothetical protein
MADAIISSRDIRVDSLTDLAATYRRNRCERIGIDSTGVPLPERVVGHRCFLPVGA